MSQDISIPLTGSGDPDAPNLTGVPGVAKVLLSNPRLDPLESSDLQPPTVTNGAALLSALSTTFPPGPTIFNFSASVSQVSETIQPPTVGISVTRSGGSAADAVSVDYQYDGPQNNVNTFPLQAGSDYATPNTDFTAANGTLSWGANDMNPKNFTITIINDTLVEFDEDIQFTLSNPRVTAASPGSAGAALGQVNKSTLTILFDDQPAGAVDRNWNPETSSNGHPGADGGIVYAVAEQPNGQPVIAGSFTSYDQKPYNRIVRLTSGGTQDTSFLVAPNSGANDFISALALQPDGRILIGGNFTAFNGNDRHRIARLNSDGSLDTTFNPGLGANGTVWSIALLNRVAQQTNILDSGRRSTILTNVVVLTNAQIVIGGDFTSVNGIGMNGVAVLNMDGTVDTTFNPGIGPDGTVNAVAVDYLGRVIIGGSFAQVSGVISGGVARLNPDGSVDSTFNPGIATYNPITGYTDPVYALAVQPDGRILIAGGFSWLDLVSYNGIARLNLDGTVDTTFASGTGTFNPVTGVTDPIYAMKIQPDGQILIGGYFTTFNLDAARGRGAVEPGWHGGHDLPGHGLQSVCRPDQPLSQS